jgi:cob(I)alamin adenosyltransferase
MTPDDTPGGLNGGGGRAPRILLFTGDGKGKTTAAFGIALRAAGHGLPTLIVQFIKARAATVELTALRSLAGVEVLQAGLGFVPRSDDAPQFAAHRQAATDGLRAAAGAMASGRYRMVILDEVCTALARGLLDEASVIAALRQAPADGVIVLTGRGATPGLIARADTVTEMRCIKHGFDAGLQAQPGVEF